MVNFFLLIIVVNNYPLNFIDSSFQLIIMASTFPFINMVNSFPIKVACWSYLTINKNWLCFHVFIILMLELNLKIQ